MLEIGRRWGSQHRDDNTDFNLFMGNVVFFSKADERKLKRIRLRWRSQVGDRRWPSAALNGAPPHDTWVRRIECGTAKYLGLTFRSIKPTNMASKMRCCPRGWNRFVMAAVNLSRSLDYIRWTLWCRGFCSTDSRTPNISIEVKGNSRFKLCFCAFCVCCIATATEYSLHRKYSLKSAYHKKWCSYTIFFNIPIYGFGILLFNGRGTSSNAKKVTRSLTR